jgi:chromosome segregation ATPase
MISDFESQHQVQSSLKHYQEQLNLLEQRNLTLHSKNERLEREVKVLNGRVESLETRNRELQITSSNTMVIIKQCFSNIIVLQTR